MSNLSSLAIKKALEQKWEDAVELNQACLNDDPSDVNAYNRLGFAHLQLGDTKRAKEAYTQALKLDKYNTISQKALERIKLISGTKTKTNPQDNLPQKTSFVEEPGKTKTVTLVRPADPSTIANLNSGILVQLTPKSRRISVTTKSGVYLGSLPDDLAYKLNHLLSIGYKYEAHVKSTNANAVNIFIRELERSDKGNDVPSFPSSGLFKHVSVKKKSIYNAPIDVTPTGEEDEQD